MQTSLQGRAKKAERRKKERFRHLVGLLNERGLKACWRDSRKDAAYGVDQVSAQDYAQNRAENSKHLVERLKQKRYRAKLGRRHDLSTGEGKQRPVGIPAVEDTLRQLAVTRLLEALSEQDFLRCSSGYRPKGGALDAVATLPIKRQCGRYDVRVEADMKRFFATIDHDWMLQMLAERRDDRALLWLITKGLKAGVVDTDGQVWHPATGTPQGGIISPILANIDRHSALDLWLQKVGKRRCQGAAWLIRYADDFGCACEERSEAERCSRERGQR